MKKFSKILILLLTVIVALTAFTVTALATEETELDPPVIKTSAWADKYNYEDDELFATFVEREYVKNSGSKAGIFRPGQSLDGNKYIVFAHDGLTSTSGGYDQIEITSGFKKAQNVADYPYLVFDFDIMTPDENGHQKSAYIVPRFTFGSTAGNYITKTNVKFSDLGLPNNPYEWHHVTIIYHFDSYIPDVETGTEYIPTVEISYYVDGEYVGKKDAYDLSADTNWKAYADNLSSVYAHSIGAFSTNTTTPNEQKSAVDNLTFTAFPEGYTESAMATYYNRNGDYELPLGKIVAKITKTVDEVETTTYYDDITEAIEAAVEGDTITLLDDVTAAVEIDAPIVVDTNKYGDDGVATGEYYSFNYASESYMGQTEKGVITFIDASMFAVSVYWDYCEYCLCDDQANHDADCSCACAADVPGHIMYAESTAVLDGAFSYEGEIPTFDIENGVSKTFIGWSRTQGGKVLTDEEMIVTQDDVDEGMIFFYPVYEVIVYTFEVSKGDSVTYHTADEFASLFTTVDTGSTIKLLRDLETNVGTIELSVKKTVTLDLNGFDIKRCYVYGTSYRYDAGDTTDEVIETVQAGGQTLFNFDTVTGYKLYIKSDVAGSDFYISTINANTWYDEDDNIVKREHLGNKYSRLAYINKNSTTLSVTSISVYATQFVYEVHGSLTGLNVKFNNCKLYRTNETGYSSNTYAAFFFATNQGGLTVTDTMIFAGANSRFWNDSSTASNKITGSMVFDNCDIIFTSAEGYVNSEFTSYNSESENPGIFFNGCRLYNLKSVGTGTNGAYFGSGTVTTEGFVDFADFADGYSLKETTSVKTYTIPTSFNFAIDSETGYPTFVFETTEFEAAFTHTVVKAFAVNWYKGEELIDTTYVAEGETAVGPEIEFEIAGDYYRNGLCVWGDKDGNAVSLVIDGAADSYAFYAYEEIDGKRAYTGDVDNAQLSLLYYTQFHMLFYLPVDETLDAAPTVSSFNKQETTVFIDGVEYWTYLQYMSNETIFNDVVCNVKYTVGDIRHTAKYNVSGRVYAELVLSNEYYVNEHESVGNMVRYVREFLEAKAITDYDQAIVNLIGTANADGSTDITNGGLYALSAYTDTYANTTSTIENYGKYISEVYFGVSSSAKSTFFFIRLSDWAYANGVTVTQISADGANTLISGATSQTPYTKNMKVYDAIGTIKVTVSVPDIAATETTEAVEAHTFTFEYSLGAYLTHLDSSNINYELAKALYAFGKSAEEYRAYVKENNITTG